MSRPIAKRLNIWAWEGLASAVTPVVLSIHILAAALVGHFVGEARTARAKQALVNTVGQSFGRFAETLVPRTIAEASTLQETLRRFDQSQTWEDLRVIAAGGEILASLRTEEIGTKHWRSAELRRNWPVRLTTVWEDRDHQLLERVILRTPLAAAPQDRKKILEGVVRLESLLPPMSMFNGPGLAVLGGSFVLLLLVCRTLCRRMKPLMSIGSNLIRHQLRLRQELSSLRLASESSAVSKAWNQLVALFEDMHNTAEQASAYRELNSALERSSSSALIEAMNVVPEGVMHVTGGDRLSYANNVACRLLGIDPASRSSLQTGDEAPLWDLPVSAFGQEVLQAIKSAKSPAQRGEPATPAQFDSKSITVRGDDDNAFRVRVMPVMHKDKGAVVLVTDISQQVKADAAREAFVSQVTHELRTPLTNIRAYTETFAEFDDPKIQAECFNVINKETRRLTRLVEEMLSRSQLDIGTMAVRRDDVDLLALVDEAVRDLKATADSKGVELNARLPAKLPTLHADRDKLAVVVSNLLGNALKYTPSGGAVSVSCEVVGDRVHVHVRDTGIGIAEEHHSRIFEHLYRVDSEAVRDQMGSGIGLTTAQEICQAHGGDIRVTSESGKGSTFTIDLPLTTPVAQGGG